MKIYKQRKYCEGCKKYFFYSTKNEPDEKRPCLVDEKHKTRDCTVRNIIESEEEL